MYELNVFSCPENDFCWREIQGYFEVAVETFNSAWIQANDDWAASSPQLLQMMKTSQNSPAICLRKLGWWCWGASLKRRMQTTPIPDVPLGGAVASVADHRQASPSLSFPQHLTFSRPDAGQPSQPKKRKKDLSIDGRDQTEGPITPPGLLVLMM